MKSLAIFFLLVALIKNCEAQNEMPSKEGKVLYELIDSSIIAPSNELFNRAKIWFGNAFRDSKEVIQIEDKENGLLMGKGNFNFEQSLVPFLIKFSIRVSVKDNKYRVQFYDITYREGTRGNTKEADGLNEKKGRDKLKNNINNEFNSLLISFKRSMMNKVVDNF